MIKKIISLLVIVFSITVTGWSQENNDNKISNKPIEIELADEAAIVIGGFRITLSDAIKKAIDNNQDILTGKYDVAMSDTAFEKSQAKYSPYFNASGTISSTDYPDLMQRSGTYPANTKSVGITSSLSKYFSTGTTIAGGVTNTNSYNTDFTNLTPPYKKYDMNIYNPVVFVSLQQELLKNSFGYNDRKEEKIQKNNAQIQKDQILSGLSLVVVGVIVDYWNVIVNKTHLDNSALMLQETKKVRRIIADNVRLGLAEQYELNYWNSQIATSEASVSQAEQQYRDALRKFLQTVNMPAEITMQEKAILQNKLPEINSEAAIKKAYSKRADYLGAVKALENAKLQLDIDGNKALPSLTGSLKVSSMDYNSSSGDAYTNTTAAKYPSYEAQIKMTYPLMDSDQKVSERNSRWRVEQTKHQVEKYGRIVKDDVTSKVEKINTNYTLYEKAREARRQAEIYYNSMLLNLRRGRITAAVVRNSLDALINSKEQELRMLVLFNASLLDFEVAKNELFETYKIDVEKYIPKE